MHSVHVKWCLVCQKFWRETEGGSHKDKTVEWYSWRVFMELGFFANDYIFISYIVLYNVNCFADVYIFCCGVLQSYRLRDHICLWLCLRSCASSNVHWSITTYLLALVQIFPTSLPVPLGGERHCGSKKGVSAWNTTTWRSNVGHAQEINYCRLYANFPRKSQWKTRKQ